MKKVLFFIFLVFIFASIEIKVLGMTTDIQSTKYVDNEINSTENVSFPSDDYSILSTIVPPKVNTTSNGVTWYYKFSENVYFDWLNIVYDYNTWDYIMQGRFAVIKTHIKSLTNTDPKTNDIQYLRFNVYVRFEPSTTDYINVKYMIKITSSKRYFYEFDSQNLTNYDNKTSGLCLTNNELTFFTTQDLISEITTSAKTVQNPEKIAFNSVENEWAYTIMSNFGSMITERITKAPGIQEVHDFTVSINNIVESVNEYQVALKR